MTRKIALAAACAVASVSSIAGEPPAGPYLGAAASAWLFDEDRFLPQEDDDAATAGLTLGWRSAGPFALEGHYGFGDEVDTWRLEGLYFFGPRAAKTAPYLLLGYTGLAFDDEGQLADGDDTTHQLSAGLGLAHRIGEGRWEVRLEGRFLQEFGHGDRATDLGFNLGLNYYFERGAEPAPVVEAAPPPKPAPQPPETRTITVELRVLFDFDKAEVKAIYGDELAAVAEAMKRHPDIVLVLEGHTDAIGTEAYNLDLSRRRVEAVKAKLVSDYGIDPARIETEAYGESRPVADNATPEGRAQNRRVVGRITFEEVVQD